MKEIQRRITITSSFLNKTSTDQLGKRRRRNSAVSVLSTAASGQIFKKDDINGFSSPSDICFICLQQLTLFKCDNSFIVFCSHRNTVQVMRRCPLDDGCPYDPSLTVDGRWWLCMWFGPTVELDERSLGFPNVPTGHTRNTKFLWLAVVIAQRNYAVQGRVGTHRRIVHKTNRLGDVLSRGRNVQIHSFGNTPVRFSTLMTSFIHT